jgi:hypothetical protein
MPLHKRQETDAAGATAREMRRTADLLDALARAKPTARQKAGARAHPEMERIARRFAAINSTLAKGVRAGSVTRAQLRSIGRNFGAIGNVLEKSAGTGR